MRAISISLLLCMGVVTGCGGRVDSVSAHSSSGSMTGSTSPSGAALSCMISASNYDQSCAADSDCVGVAAGNYCGSNPTCNCGGFTDAISAGVLTQFNADVAKTPSGPQVTCPCPMPVEPPGTTSAVCCETIMARKAFVRRCGVCTTVLPPACAPMAARCLNGGVNTCAPNGQWQQAVEVCGPGETCVEGSCVAVEAGTGPGQDSGSVVGSILGAGCEQEGDAGVRNLSDDCMTQIPLVGPCVVSAGSPTPEQCVELCAPAPWPVQGCQLVQPAPDGGTYLACFWQPCLR
jgi:hypothetical protein